MFNSTFQKTSVAGTFTDPGGIPANCAPYNIQNVGGKLYIEYAKVDPVTHRASEDVNQGIVSVFDTNGNFLQRVATDTHLNSPWGVTMAPAGFGGFGGDLLVGNFGDGTISAFNPLTGAFLGALSDIQGNPIENDGIWAINFRASGSGSGWSVRHYPSRSRARHFRSAWASWMSVGTPIQAQDAGITTSWPGVPTAPGHFVRATRARAIYIVLMRM